MKKIVVFITILMLCVTVWSKTRTFSDRVTNNTRSYPSPHSVEVEIANDDQVVLTWEYGDRWLQDFEVGDIPEGWIAEGINTDFSPIVSSFWHVTGFSSPDWTPRDEYHAGLYWSVNPQDEWLITPEFVCPYDAELKYWTVGRRGSTHGDHYYVKITTDGGENWTILQDLSALTGGWNRYHFPFVIPLDEYFGETIQIAWNAYDGDDNVGLWYLWFVDDISIGNVNFRGKDLTMKSKSRPSCKIGKTDTLSQVHDYSDYPMARDSNEAILATEHAIVSDSTYPLSEPILPRINRSWEGYAVYRFLEEDNHNIDLWTELTTITHPAITVYNDMEWMDLTPGLYQYAVKTLYAGGNSSEPVLSDAIDLFVYYPVVIAVTTNSGDPVSGAEVTLSNVTENPYHVYQESVPESGIIEFANVCYGYYNLTVELEGFETYEVSDVYISEDYFTYELELIEALTPVSGLHHTITEDNSVILEWYPPGTIVLTEQWLHWDSGENHDAIGTGSESLFSVATRFTQQHTEDLNVGGLYLTTIRFWPNEPEAAYTLKVWQGGSAEPWDSGVEVYSQAVGTVMAQSWNEIALVEPVFIDPDQEIWFGYSVATTQGYPAGCDEGPAIQGHGNLIFHTGSWFVLTDLNGSLDYNWNIQGYAGSINGENAKVMKNGSDKERGVSNRSDCRSIIGYKILRDDVLLADEYTKLTFSDHDVPLGTYVYSVIAQYTTGESPPSSTDPVIILSNDEQTAIPYVTELRSNFPNPFNPETAIKFSLQNPAQVNITVYNLRGQKVRELENRYYQQGIYSVVWDGKNDSGLTVGSGVYFCRMESGGYKHNIKMIMLK